MSPKASMGKAGSFSEISSKEDQAMEGRCMIQAFLDQICLAAEASIGR